MIRGRAAALGLLPLLVLARLPAAAEPVVVEAAAALDEPRGLCLDVPGHRDRTRTTAPMVVHTCKWGMWNHDERFDRDEVARGLLRMPRYGLCLGAAGTGEGAELRLGECDDAPLRRWRFAEGRFRLAAAPGMCLTIGPEPSELTPGGRRLTSRHVARSLALSACRAAAADRQEWRLADPGGRGLSREGGRSSPP